MIKSRLIISNYDDLKNPYYAGGGAVAVHEVARRLTDSFLVTVITSAYPGSSDQVVDGVLYRRIGLKNAGPFISQIIYSLLLPLSALGTSFDLWLETFGPPFTAAFLPLFTKKPVIALVHMLPALDMQRKYPLPVLPRLVEILALKTYSRFIVLTEDSRRDIARYHPQAAIQVIPNGVTSPSRLPILAPQHLLFIGRLEVNQKGLDLLLYAYRLLQAENPLPLVIAGSGSVRDTARIRRLITRLGLTDQVVLTGRVTGSIRDRLFRSALFIIQPSRFETFSLVALEALSYGKALVCFDIPGLKWLPTFCAHKAAALTPQSLYQAMVDCLASPESLRRLSRHSRALAHHYNWDRIAADYASVLASAYQDTWFNWSTSLKPKS